MFELGLLRLSVCDHSHLFYRPTHYSFAIPLCYHGLSLPGQVMQGHVLSIAAETVKVLEKFFFCVRSTVQWRLYVSNLFLDCPFWSAHLGQVSFTGVLRRARRTRHCHSARRCPLLVSLSMVMRRFSCFWIGAAVPSCPSTPDV